MNNELTKKGIEEEFNKIINTLKQTGNEFKYYDNANRNWIDQQIIDRVNNNNIYQSSGDASIWIGYFLFNGIPNLLYYYCDLLYNYVQNKYTIYLRSLENDYESVSMLESVSETFYFMENSLKYSINKKRCNDSDSYLDSKVFTYNQLYFNHHDTLNLFNKYIEKGEKMYLPNLYKVTEEAYPQLVIADKILKSSISIPYAGGHFDLYLSIAGYAIDEIYECDY